MQLMIQMAMNRWKRDARLGAGIFHPRISSQALEIIKTMMYTITKASN